MKKLFIYLIIIPLLHSCVTPLEITKFPKEETLYAIDFTPYSQKGFFITPEKYTGEYESIGLVDFVCMPAANLTDTYINTSKLAEKTYASGGKTWIFDQIKLQDAIDGMYKRCLEMGANALINFRCTDEIQDYLFIKNPVTIKGYRISGFAIKTK